MAQVMLHAHDEEEIKRISLLSMPSCRCVAKEIIFILWSIFHQTRLFAVVSPEAKSDRFDDGHGRKTPSSISDDLLWAK